MPVKLEHLTQPADADWTDLEKIRSETSPLGLDAGMPLADWITPERWIIGGRFNDRIIGALLAERIGNDVTLSHAGVRTITQRRGVLHQMIHFLQTWANDQNLTLRTPAGSTLDDALLKRSFQRNGELLVYKKD